MSSTHYVSDLKSKISLSPSRQAIKRAALALALALGVAGAADFGYGYLTTGRYLETTDDAYVKADSTIVAPKVSGYIAEVLVSDNEKVMAGQLLARIDDLVALVKTLTIRIAELEAKLGEPKKTPDNSSLPPSSAPKSNGEVVSAEATHGIAAIADPMPSPTASPLTRPTNFADFMGLPTLSAPRAAADCQRFGADTS